jgi:adenine C2-methylase RlmN of 23S rRNA A2503 and tRNA A37
VPLVPSGAFAVHELGTAGDELAARAALQGKSMQEYLRAELVRLAARPSVEKVLERIRERKATTGTRLSPEEILAHRDADRP